MFGRLLIIAVAGLILWGVVARASHGAGPERVYLVKPHDTLWSIAQRHYGGDVRDAIWRIERANHLPGADVRAGQRLVLP